MTTELDRRTYDLLRLIGRNEPIGSIRLVKLMQQRGYSIKDRSVRFMLTELDEEGLTKKIPGKGRELTEKGRIELARGDVTGRLEQVRDRIALVTSQVTYDPIEDTGELVTGRAYVNQDDISAAFDSLCELVETGLGPVIVDVQLDGDRLRIDLPSSITAGGILLSHGINSRLMHAGLVEYEPTTSEVPDADAVPSQGEIIRHIDAISGEGSTMDVVSLLIEAQKSSIESVCAQEQGILLVDHREFPLIRFDEVHDLLSETANHIGGAFDLHRPRESDKLDVTTSGWEFASVTYAGTAENALGLLRERGLLAEWDTINGVVPRNEFKSVLTAKLDWVQ